MTVSSHSTARRLWGLTAAADDTSAVEDTIATDKQQTTLTQTASRRQFEGKSRQSDQQREIFVESDRFWRKSLVSSIFSRTLREICNKQQISLWETFLQLPLLQHFLLLLTKKIMASRRISFSQPPKVMSSLSSLALLCLAAILLLTAQAHAQTPQNLGQALSSGSVLSSVLRDVLSERGVSDDDIDDILFTMGARLMHTTGLTKRVSGWKRIPIQARFAPFGTKLVPSRTYGDSSGSTLLRYGRSVDQ